VFIYRSQFGIPEIYQIHLIPPPVSLAHQVLPSPKLSLRDFYFQLRNFHLRGSSFHVWDPLACSESEWTSGSMNPFRCFGRTPWTGDRPIARPQPYTGQHNSEKRGHTSMPLAGLKPTIPVFELWNTVLTYFALCSLTAETEVRMRQQWRNYLTARRTGLQVWQHRIKNSFSCIQLKLSLCLTKHHAIKTSGSGGIAPPHILNLVSRWRWVVSFTTRPLYLQAKILRYALDRRLGGTHSRSEP